ncbi:TetR/AcrR family transcriptional regulator [Paenibacillus oralis]|uniref:TetR/AcrR family transcriptional regulator n=1 Tax=Paenibacillus oralis TaxID=2490856 RepID=A0A3P3TV74_9BACL|nr:TetR/AcrR family transcriptional regulator [Paenibacillus oralis]RRJ62045.1 TetR/AcrR family transcriptional regulator [Paenibacillus oralis]
MSPRIGLDSTAVLMAAVEVANAEGAAAVSISSVARKLGIRPPSLYNHVSGLEEIRAGLAKYALERLYDHIAGAVGDLSGEHAIRRFADAYLAFAHEHPGLYEAVQMAPGPEDRQLQEAGSRLVELTLRYLSSYPLTEEQALHTVRGLRSLIHGFASLKRQGGFGLPLEVRDSLHFNLDLLLGGLKRLEGENGR